mgnify:CR=1 FL=1
MWGKNDGSYDSLTSWDESPDFIKKIKEAKEAQIKKEAKEAHQKKEKTKKWEKKREGAMLLSFYHTCASE